MNFNLNWTFYKENGETTKVDLPHDAMLLEKRDSLGRSGKHGAFFPGGKYTYEKKFNLSEEEVNKYIALFFEGVYQNCKIFLNEIEVGNHKYGYTEFTVDISSIVKPGENLLVIIVDNSLQPNCRWYSGSGIYRPVSLIIKEKTHPKTLKILTKSYSPAIIEVISDSDAKIEIYDDDRLIASGAPGEYEIRSAKLWSDKTPNLYRCDSILGNERISTAFGIRKIEWNSQNGFLINGQELLLRGGCIHHDNGILGAVTYYDAEERRVRILKEAGYNAIRCAHNPASRALLDACDKLGMLVMDESFDGWYIPKTYHDYSRWFENEYKADLKAMIEKDFNHPSVIMYSIGNEVSETASDKGIETCGLLVQYVRSLDNSRPITCGVNVLLNVYVRLGLGVYKDKNIYSPTALPPIKKGYKEKKVGSQFFNSMINKLGPLMFFMSKGKKGDRATKGAAEKTDIIGLNYASSRYDIDAKKYPDRMMVGAETMITDMPYNWERVKKHKTLVGDFVWAAWDYLGEAGVGDWTYHSYQGLPLLAGSGTIDITGYIGAEAYYSQIIWGLRNKPYICVRPLNHVGETPSKSAWRFTNAIESWNWQGYEGKTATIEVYSDAHSIRLVLNGKVIGKKKVKKYKAIFKTPYQFGELKAIALDEKGSEISISKLRSGSEETILSVVPEKASLKAGSDDLCYISIEFTDNNGCIKPYIEQRVDVSVNGCVSFLGLGSALGKTDELYNDYHHNTFRGRALAIVKAGSEKGFAEITVKSVGYDPVTVRLEVK